VLQQRENQGFELPAAAGVGVVLHTSLVLPVALSTQSFEQNSRGSFQSICTPVLWSSRLQNAQRFAASRSASARLR
jgi:hypothetical protein